MCLTPYFFANLVSCLRNVTQPRVANSPRQLQRSLFCVALDSTQKGRIGKKCARKYRVDSVFTGRGFHVDEGVDTRTQGKACEYPDSPVAPGSGATSAAP
jgi:hypothetical protein